MTLLTETPEEEELHLQRMVEIFGLIVSLLSFIRSAGIVMYNVYVYSLALVESTT